MGLMKLNQVTLITPRSELGSVMEELYEFGFFHPAGEGERDPVLRELERRVDKNLVALELVIQELNIRAEAGVLEQLAGRRIAEQREFTADDINGLLDRLDSEAGPLINELNNLLETRRRLREGLNSMYPILEGLKLVSGLNIDLNTLGRIRRFYVLLAVVQQREVAELRRSLTEAVVVEHPLQRGYSATLIIANIRDADRVDRIVKGLGVRPFDIPRDLPQNTSEAFKVFSGRVAEAENKLREVEDRLNTYTMREASKLLALRDAYKVLKEAVHRLAPTGMLKRFAVVKGYIPENLTEEFIRRFGSKYPVYSSHPMQLHHGHEHGGEGGETSKPPTLLSNKGVVKAFENITKVQGIPGYFEIDPTPFVAFFFAIFYGIMFADLGQGIIIFLFSLFMLKRTTGNLRLWAMLLAVLGVSSSIGGFMIGEAFGFKIGKTIPTPGILELVEVHNGTKQFNIAEVQKLLIFTILMGALHIVVGYVLSIVKLVKNGEALEAFTSKIPTLTMYLFGILFALAFFGAGGRMENIMTEDAPAPLIGLPTSLVGTVGIAGAIASIFALLFGKLAAGFAGLGPKVGFVSAIGQGLLEVLENIIHFLSNTISYARLAILLIVHIALLLLLNTAWEALGIVSLPILVVGNVGIILLEGMLVFIQALRLHLYEFFTKFYDGVGYEFRRIAEETPFARVIIGRR